MRDKILVIEDDMDISNLICMNLEAAGYETKPVYDGNQAVEQIEKGEDYDLALLDLMLPGRDGLSPCGPKAPGFQKASPYNPQLPFSAPVLY